MRIELSEHQLNALDRIHNGCILHGGVGSGKSRTALAYYYILFGGALAYPGDTQGRVWITNGSVLKMGDRITPRMQNPCDLYIITTAKKRDSLEWEGELTPFLLSPDPDANGYSNKVVIDSWNNIGKYKDVKKAFFIFDEQRVVGSGAWVKSFLKITKTNQWILLSATPGDTWTDYIPVFVANGFYRNRTEFKEQHIVYKPFTKFPQIDRYLGVDRLTRLRDRILVDMDFERSTVRHHELINTEFDRSEYMGIVRKRWNPWRDAPIETPGEYCQCLRRVVSEDKSRQQAVLDLFKRHKRVIIFYNFDYERDILLGLPYEKDVEIAEWSGHKHQPVPNSDRWVYLVQYNAGSEGWNCITTDTIIFYSENYSYRMMEQATGRIDRMNTKFIDLNYYHLTSKSTIEKAIRRALVAKKQFNETRFTRGLLRV